jgi:hypothetical protein
MNRSEPGNKESKRKKKQKQEEVASSSSTVRHRLQLRLATPGKSFLVSPRLAFHFNYLRTVQRMRE